MDNETSFQKLLELVKNSGGYFCIDSNQGNLRVIYKDDLCSSLRETINTTIRKDTPFSKDPFIDLLELFITAREEKLAFWEQEKEMRRTIGISFAVIASIVAVAVAIASYFR